MKSVPASVGKPPCVVEVTSVFYLGYQMNMCLVIALYSEGSGFQETHSGLIGSAFRYRVYSSETLNGYGLVYKILTVKSLV